MGCFQSNNKSVFAKIFANKEKEPKIVNDSYFQPVLKKNKLKT